MDFRMLGPLEVSERGRALGLGGPKQRLVLAHLLVRANQVVAAERLIDEVWGEAPPPAVRANLQSYVSRLRRVLGSGRIEGLGSGYRLRVDPDEVDGLRFESLTREGHRLLDTDPEVAAALLRRALGLWRGQALADLAGEGSLEAEAARLEELRIQATEDRIAADLALGGGGELAGELEALVVAHPLREHVWGQLMVALYRAGRQADALAAFERVRRLLSEELGVDPSPELQQLHTRILRQDPGLQPGARALRGYQLLEQVGQGAHGVVWRGIQPGVEREVAIKAIHPRLADQAEFIRRFEAEAQRVARIEHPHVVPLYDYWREPGGAYLVMRFLRGGSLRALLDRDRSPAPELAARIAEQVTGALAAAHHHGVVHRDVKAANVLLDEEGNAYLSDFGVAADTDPASSEPATPATDVYGLGGILTRLLPDPATDLRAVLDRATAADPAARYPDAAALLTALREALAPAPAVLAAPGAAAATAVPAPAVASVRNPYKGLRSFAEADAADFFGRDALTMQLLSRLRSGGPDGRFVAVVGPSGSGKSSVVRAGLIPALRAGALSGSASWFIVQLTPGSTPFAELEAALRTVAVDLPDTLAAELELGAGGLVSAAERVLPDGDGELLVVVDQLEELFTLVLDGERRRRFLRLLTDAVTDPAGRVRVVVTLRADFYDRPLLDPGFAPLFTGGVTNVTPLTADELERAIAGPAERVRVPVDPGLVARMVADVADQPGALPLLQYALTELFEGREDTALTLAAYGDVGGVSGALTHRADRLFDGLADGPQQAVRQLFLRLVALGEGTDDTRRRVPRSELVSLDVDPGEVGLAIEVFGRARLLTFDRDADTREPTVEVAHEALIREWGRLRTWVDEARDDLRTQRRLAAAARDWTGAGRDPSFLATGSRLDRFEALQGGTRIAFTPEERGFLEASLAERERRRAEEQARQARERELERRSHRRLRALVGVFAAAALVAGGLTVVALRQSDRLAQQVRVTTARQLAAAAVANLDVDPERSILIALEAVEVTRGLDGTVLPEAEEALHRAVKTSRLVRTIPHGSYTLAVTSDGTRAVTTGARLQDNTARVWDLDSGQELLVLTGPDVGRLGVALSTDNRLYATGHNDQTTWLWDAGTGERLAEIPLEGMLAFSPDGRWLALGGFFEPTVRIWDLASGVEVMALTGHDEPISSTVFDPQDSTRLATGGDDGTVRVWDLTAGRVIFALAGLPGPVPLAFSPDGALLATGHGDGTDVRDAATGTVLRTLSGDGPTTSVAYSPDGTRLATGSSDSTVTVWDAGTGRRLRTLAGHTADVVSIAFTPDGERLVTSALDNSTKVWDVSVAGGRDWLTVAGPVGRWATVAFHPDGTRFAAPADPSGVRIHDVATGEVLATFGGHDAEIVTPVFSPDGGKLAGAGFFGGTATSTVPVWDADTGEVAFELGGHDDEIIDVAFSPDGRRLATAGGFDGTVRLWDAASGRLERVIQAAEFAGPVAFSPDGRLLAAQTSRGQFQGATFHLEHVVFEVDTGERIAVLEGHDDGGTGLVFAPDGRLVTGTWDGTARVWDVDTGEALWVLRHDTPLQQVAVSADGTHVATAGEDGNARLWGLDTGRQVLTLYAHDAPAFGVTFSPDGRLLATAGLDGTIALHLLPIDELIELARTRVTRSLTDAECRQYLQLAACPPPQG